MTAMSARRHFKRFSRWIASANKVTVIGQSTRFLNQYTSVRTNHSSGDHATSSRAHCLRAHSVSISTPMVQPAAYSEISNNTPRDTKLSWKKVHSVAIVFSSYEVSCFCTHRTIYIVSSNRVTSMNIASISYKMVYTSTYFEITPKQLVCLNIARNEPS